MPEGTIERPLSPSLPRDCGHECRVCKVTLVSLTDYASHISSPVHKQNVEAAEQKPAGSDRDEDYFDQVLVDLIEKRKETIRKEKEAAAVKLAQEEEQRKRREEFQQRLKEAKERYGLESAAQGFGGPRHPNSWYRGNRYNVRDGEPRPWHYNKKGKSATWHADEPPNFQRWRSEDFVPGHLLNQDGWCNRQWDRGVFHGEPQNRLPWLSNGGSSNGLYGRNNICQNPQRGRPMSFAGTSMYPPFFAQALKQCHIPGNAAQRPNGPHNGVGQTAEPDHGSSKTSKTYGSNPKLDKACRWSPYPVAKGFDPVPQKDNSSTSLVEKHPKAPRPQGNNKAPEICSFTRPEQKPGVQSVEAKGKNKTNPKTKPREPSSSSSSRSSSAQRDGHESSASASSNPPANKAPSPKDRKTPPVCGGNAGAQGSKALSKVKAQSTTKAPPAGLLQSRQERQLPDVLSRARQIMLEKKSSVDSSRNNRAKEPVQAAEGQQRDHVESHTGVNKENSCRRKAAKPNLPDTVRPEKPESESTDSSQFLQSLQVSTSTEPAASGREEDEDAKKEDAEAAQSSESDNSRNGDTQPGSSTSGLSKLDLPPVLKRDLTKHISSKSKTGNHEPNLNNARRVRNLSESRRSDTEKDSGLKPTVRQLISSSGSRRNVNWEQVYQEVRKKQDKGKGMPRFGIEMVPLDQEEHSQEEEDIPLLEGFQWDSMMEVSASGTSRKRSLSESSVAPASTHSLFSSLMLKEEEQEQGEDLGSDQTASFLSQDGKDDQRQEELEQMLGRKQPEKLMSASAKALQRSDSALGDSSSGTEQQEGQGTGKRRRVTGDVQNAEPSCLEHNSKRRKVKSKKERLQIDQLLTVSLREDELSRSLQTVDTSLIQARAALQAAYMEVQRLIVVKQQMTGEMSTLRKKRIELLKGMQDNQENALKLKVKEEKMEAAEAEPTVPPSVASSPPRDAAASAPTLPPLPPPPPPPADHTTPPPPSHSLPFIKQEPQSPVHVSSELDPADDATHAAHSTTPELLADAPAASPPDPPLNFPSSPEPKPELHRSHCAESVDCKQSSLLPGETSEKATETSWMCPPDCKASVKLLLASRGSSEAGSVVDSAAAQFSEPAPPPPVPSAANLSTCPSELRSGKLVRRLKKRKVLKKAQGTEQPESSDTELDGEQLRPRWLRPRRRPSGSSQASTSTQPGEDRDVNMEGGDEDSAHRSPPRTADPPQTLESEENMEVTAACQQLHVDVPTSSPAPDSSRPEPQSLACNEVTSTSDMDICRSSESDVQYAISVPKITKASSDASSDHGEDDLPTDGAFEGHQEAVNAMQIHNGHLYTCSGDRTVKVFDLVSHKCVGVFEGHSSKVSCLLVSAAPSLHHRLYSGSSDQTIRCYSLKTRELEQQFILSDRVLCLHSRWQVLYAGLANGSVVTFSLRTNRQTDVFECHGPRAVSCLASSQEGARRILLVGSYDSTISVRDAKNGLLLRTLEGHTKTVLCMKVVNDLVFSGSSDQCVSVHNIHTGELQGVYKGHSHAVTVVSVLGKVMVTACLDKLVRVYDLQSHEQLQVYGGHKDMVMCMAVHKNMIYTGCYDGSVHARRMNLLQNYRCWWHGCSLVFGVMEHLQQHLVSEHSNNLQIVKCHWKNCQEFFCSRSSSSSKQVTLTHIQKHAREDAEVEP
ncbi:uncharacterized protein V6R79_024969 [Siganus canaliculatus]